MRLINADAVIEKAHHEAKAMPEPFKSEFGVLVEWIVNKTPSVESEIVRCKACKFYIDHRCYEPHSSIADWRTENDYCSFAERRTDG